MKNIIGVWPNTTVLRMLADEQYMGTYIQGRAAVREIGSGSVRRKDRSEWFILPDHHEPIVSRELYEQFVTEKIPLDDFQAEKQRCDRDAQTLRNTLQMLAARQQEMQENREASARFNALREEVLSSGSLTQAIAEKLIKKVTVYHDRQIEIEFAVQDFLKDGCGTGMEPAE